MEKFIEAILLGLVQGLTEFLPISSSGHLLVVRKLLGVSDPTLFYTVILHFSTLLAVGVVFRNQIYRLLMALFRIPTFLKNLFQKGHLAIADDDEAWTCILIIFTTIVTGFMGYFFEKQFTEANQWRWMAPLGFFLTGTALYSTKNLMLDKTRAKQKREGKFVSQVTIKDAMLLGLAQAISIFPAISRSGSTISAALWLRVNRKFAGEFSFLISIPSIVGALILKSRHGVAVEQDLFLPYVLGSIMAFVTGYISLIFLLRWIQKGKLHYFAFYCWAMSIFTFILA